MPLFTGDYLSDTRHLTAQEHGAYLLLLMMAWRTSTCSLPNDDEVLARWASVDRRTWKKIKPKIMAFWTNDPSGNWIQQRLTEERVYVSKRAEVARQNGARGGRPKSLKDKEQSNPAGCSRVSQTETTHTHTQTKKDNSVKGADAPRELSPRGEFYTYGEVVLGQKQGPTLTSLLKACNEDLVLAQSVLTQAHGAANPKQYVWGVINKGRQNGKRTQHGNKKPDGRDFYARLAGFQSNGSGQNGEPHRGPEIDLTGETVGRGRT